MNMLLRKLSLPTPALPTLALLVLTASAVFGAAPGVTDLGQGIGAYNTRDFNSAIARLQAARSVTKLADYDAYYLGYSQLLTGNVDGALATLNAYRAHPVEASPLAGKISVLYARVLINKRDPESIARALAVLEADSKLLPQPDGDFAVALAQEAKGDAKQAAVSYERAFYFYPNTDLAAQASTAIDRLRASMGKDFPAAPPREMLDRAAKWLDVKEYAKARLEYSTLADILAGPDKDEAKLGIGVTDYLSGDTKAAFEYLQALRVAHSETDAERLYYLTEAARKAGNDTALTESIRNLDEHYRESPWRLKALVTAGNRYLVTNEREKYQPLFKAAAADFPPDTTTALCHWRITWDAYLTDDPDRVTLLREQAERYPDDSHAGTALYFLGRIAEATDKFGEAKAYYQRLSAQYPHYFYAVLGRERITGKVVATMPDEDAVMWLSGIAWPAHRDLSASAPNPATQQRIDRARLLTDADLTDFAESELRFGAKTETEQPQLLALELAAAADSPFRAMRVMKSMSGDYLSLPFANASPKFWQTLFPLPWRDELVSSAKAHGLDPYYVAGLIRQESEFNPAAKSRKSAYGLMQLLPTTGRMLSKKEGMGLVSVSQLTNPVVSLRLGTNYLRTQLDSWDGDWYRTLAAYNAGPGRVHQWLKDANFREPLEFIESIPFNETREYIQAVLRNADVYRELYTGKPEPAATPAQLITSKKPASPPASRKTTVVAKKSTAPSQKSLVASKKTKPRTRTPHTSTAAVILAEPRP
jgi:peptidoglycan lytic transglycosylase